MTRETISNRIVTFSTPYHGGAIVVKVFLNLPTPRIVAYHESPTGPEPVSMFFDELTGFVERAKILLQAEDGK